MKEEDPVEVDSSPPCSPGSISSDSDGGYGDPPSMKRVGERALSQSPWCYPLCHIDMDDMEGKEKSSFKT